jgi:hypothetical protein
VEIEGATRYGMHTNLEAKKNLNPTIYKETGTSLLLSQKGKQPSCHLEFS